MRSSHLTYIFTCTCTRGEFRDNGDSINRENIEISVRCSADEINLCRWPVIVYFCSRKYEFTRTSTSAAALLKFMVNLGYYSNEQTLFSLFPFLESWD